MRTCSLLIACCLVLAAQAPEYDLLLKGGRLLDPKNNVDSRLDVAIAAGKIAAIAPSIPAAKAVRTVDVRGLVITPGLVDIHAHVFAATGKSGAYNGDLSVFPDANCLPFGVTTVADAGSSGAMDFADFKQKIISRSKTRVLAFLNIVVEGMGGRVEQDTSLMDPVKTAEVCRQNRADVVGIKTAHYAGPEWIAVERAVEAGKACDVPVMVDFGTFRPERPFQELVLSKLRPGDIYTHLFLPWVPLLDEQGKVAAFMLEARKRGVVFDVGHGGGSFVFRYAVPAVKQGFLPDSISTDLHASSRLAGMKDMLNVMSKFLNMGMPLREVILRSTWNPAREIRREELGHLSVGAVADVAVLRVEPGRYGFVDSYGARMDGTRRLICELTVRNGKVVWDLNGMTRDGWDKLGKYNAQGNNRWDGVIGDGLRQRR